MDQYSYIANADVDYISDLYDKYQQDPSSVDTSWQNFFKGYDFSAIYGEKGATNGVSSNGTSNGQAKPADAGLIAKEGSVLSLIKAYRSRGHLLAKTNPLGYDRNVEARLTLEDYKLSEKDLDTVFEAGHFLLGRSATLREIMAALEKIYAGNIGFEYMYVRNMEEKEWLRNQIEKAALVFDPTKEEKERILKKLNEAVTFEQFLHTKFLGQKRFSLEGGEATISSLDTIINTSADMGVKEVMIGMAHRGRLNVLVNIMHKSYDEIISGFVGQVPELEDNLPNDINFGGDVKYHLGYSSTHVTPKGTEVSLKLAPNPSHLETVNPVVEGFVRSRADGIFEGDYDKVMPILIHGDAAVAGQGIVYEVTQMAKLPAYKTGGTIHFVINNQIGFTTDAAEGRSAIYCTDIAKIIDAPVFHVNGDDPEAVMFVSKMAVEYRQEFNQDVFINMLCYRRWGHNESDEPSFTQPTMYSQIKLHKNVLELYNEQLVSRGKVDAKLAKGMEAEFKQFLQDRLDGVKQAEAPVFHPLKLDEDWKALRYGSAEDFEQSPDTSVSRENLDKIFKALTTLPEGFKPLKQIDKLISDRKKLLEENGQVNWATAELMAYGSLLMEGKTVRMTGQDVQRGTFSHRHAVLHDAENNKTYTQIDHIEEGQEQMQIFNSLLSEYGVLGFEFGYSMANAHALVIWEAQFGDFANGAQIIIDQFVSSCESKWGLQNGLVMLLPHGYEGQGPEHSNARPERFLQLCGDYNMVVANVTTPANIFHLMRRQLTWDFRKPLVIMSPKSMLRHPLNVSPLEDLTTGGFREVIGDSYVNTKEVKKVLLCTGKVYYDLLDKQQKDQRKDVAIVRVEQLHPLPLKQIQQELGKYAKAKVYWVQEEPKNMGYWSFILREFGCGVGMGVISRKTSASPATGFLKTHSEEQAALIQEAFA
ncbi:2-oxoglutarate dehydrogenase E1 component [Siphonobacter sp.]|uniref:2-oxoglutarate dehydrogenase E1 component n=1 Tax=Siphonobacter sp. TaxID=1869184 RepID=UPI003B3B52F2